MILVNIFDFFHQVIIFIAKNLGKLVNLILHLENLLEETLKIFIQMF